MTANNTFAWHEGRRPYLSPVVAVLLAMLIATPHPVHAHPPAQQAAITAALGVLDDFMLAFNRRDMSAWASTLSYPHVRFASGTVRVWPDQQSFEATPPFAALQNTGWEHSQWMRRDIVLAAADKVHIATTFERFNAANESIGRFESLYIVTRVDGRWGIQARSSLAP